MSKYLEAIDKIMEIYGNTNSLEGTYNYFLTIKKGLQRLEAIDNARPSEFKIVNYKGQYYLQINVNDDEATQIQLPLLEDEIKDVQLAIDKFKQIDSSNPSEALECLERIEKYFSDRNMYEDLKLESNMCYNGIGIIKQYIIKAQEQEKGK